MEEEIESLAVTECFRYDLRDPRSLRWLLKAFWLHPQYQAVVLFRLSQRFSGLLSLWIRRVNLQRNGVDISNRARIGRGLRLEHPVGIVVGAGVRAGRNLTLYHNVVLGQRDGWYPRIGDNVTIWPNAVVVGGISVGDRAIIGAQAVVLSDVGGGAVVAGVPARPVGELGRDK